MFKYITRYRKQVCYYRRLYTIISFGFSISNFLAIIEFAKKIKKNFASAPNKFKGTLDIYVHNTGSIFTNIFIHKIRSLSIVLQDTKITASERDLNPKKETNLQTISNSYQNILIELKDILAKYIELDS
jgi:hypothetical protein